MNSFLYLVVGDPFFQKSNDTPLCAGRLEHSDHPICKQSQWKEKRWHVATVRARCRAARDRPGGSAASSHGWSVEALKKNNKFVVRKVESGKESLIFYYFFFFLPKSETLYTSGVFLLFFFALICMFPVFCLDVLLLLELFYPSVWGFRFHGVFNFSAITCRYTHIIHTHNN